MMGWSRRRVAACGAFGIAMLGGGSLAVAAGGPSAKRLKALGSSAKAAHKQPNRGLGASLPSQPLIAVSFANNKATVLGGSAVSAGAVHARIANVPISAAQCSVNFTTRKTRV